MRSLAAAVAVACSAAVAVGLRVQQSKNNNPASQVHLALGRNASSAVVTWSTPLDGAPSVVQLVRCDNSTMWGDNENGGRRREDGAEDDDDALSGLSPPPVEVQGYARKFVDNGTLHNTQFVHRVTLTDLAPGARYCYRVADNSTQSSSSSSSGDRWGQLHSFRTFPAFSAEEWTSPSVTVFGDFGLENPRSLPWLQRDVAAGRSDLVVHNGDFAYDLCVVGFLMKRLVECTAAWCYGWRADGGGGGGGGAGGGGGGGGGAGGGGGGGDSPAPVPVALMLVDALGRSPHVVSIPSVPVLGATTTTARYRTHTHTCTCTHARLRPPTTRHYAPHRRYQNNGTWGDQWLESVTPVAATQYYMTSIGNHEPIYDSLHYRARFSMPGHDDPERLANGTENLWYR
jgi:hypothetical protein